MWRNQINKDLWYLNLGKQFCHLIGNLAYHNQPICIGARNLAYDSVHLTFFPKSNQIHIQLLQSHSIFNSCNNSCKKASFINKFCSNQNMHFFSILFRHRTAVEISHFNCRGQNLLLHLFADTILICQRI